MESGELDVFNIHLNTNEATDPNSHLVNEYA
jgi:hypothetical protein